MCIRDRLKVITRGDSFLFWDSGEDDPQRLFVFCTDRNIDTLEQNAHRFMDGTFKVAPELFAQLFTIHALVDNQPLSMVYVLLQSKTQADDERVFRKLLESKNTLTPSSILLDFEKATLQASAAVFPHVTVTGCLFHLGQSLWRRIQNEGLVNNYRDYENVRMFAKMLLVLSFVPPDDVAECFDELNDNRPDELAPVYDYREDNYIGRLRSHRRSAPTFPIALWNMRSRVTDGLTRTNNSVEGWHHAFQSSVACHHPNIYKLMDHIQTEQDHTEQQIARFSAGNQTSVSSKNKYIQVIRRLTALLLYAR